MATTGLQCGSGCGSSCSRVIVFRVAGNPAFRRQSQKQRQLVSVRCAQERSRGDEECENQGSVHSALKTLDSYFDKLHPKPEVAAPSSDPVLQVEEKHQWQQQSNQNFNIGGASKDEHAIKEELLLSILKEFEDKKAAQAAISATRQASKENAAQASSEEKPLVVLNPNSKRDKEMPVIVVRPGSFIVSILSGISIGVYIFGLASVQQKGTDLALLYGAKVNDLILSGQWWRLITPSFLHSGFLHLFLSCWALFSFGPLVESLYGSSGLLTIYFMGGVMGNLVSFLQTPQPTVGGTGPAFAIICSWIMFLTKNRNVVKAFDTSELLQKVAVLSALTVLLGNQLPIDAWTDVGGALVGVVFGLVASPGIEVVDAKDIRNSKTELSLETLALAFVLFCGAYLCLSYFAGLQENISSLY